jgi:hypothetical protein
LAFSAYFILRQFRQKSPEEQYEKYRHLINDEVMRPQKGAKWDNGLDNY